MVTEGEDSSVCVISVILQTRDLALVLNFVCATSPCGFKHVRPSVLVVDPPSEKWDTQRLCYFLDLY